MFHLRLEEITLTRVSVMRMGRDRENSIFEEDHHRPVRKYSVQITVGYSACLILEYEMGIW